MLKLDFIPLARPDIREEDIQAAVQVMETGMLVQGKNVELFEKNISAYLGIKHAAALSNGTATLHTALVSLGIGHGDEVIVPAFSYVATANVVELTGAKTVFCDIEPHSFNIDPTAIESLITKNTKAIIPVHEFGLSCNMEAIVKIAKKHKLFIIEDAACALGAKQNGVFAGTTGHFGSFSFHPRKAISSGEGGMLVSNEEALIDDVKILRNHGIELKEGKMDFVKAGFNYRMTDFQAALVNSQLKRLNSILEYKNKLAQIYFNEIDNKNVQLPVTSETFTHTWQTFHVLLKGMDRSKVIKKLADAGIGTNYGAQCIPEMTYYKRKYSIDSPVVFPNAYNAFINGLAIPLYERLSPKQIKYIADEVNKL